MILLSRWAVIHCCAKANRLPQKINSIILRGSRQPVHCGSFLEFRTDPKKAAVAFANYRSEREVVMNQIVC